MTITGTYSGVSRTASLTVTPPPLEARFTITSKTRGANACEIQDAAGALDCEPDGSSSTGVIAEFRWRLRLDDDDFTVTTTTPTVKFSPPCSFLDSGGNAGDDGSVSMQVALKVLGKNNDLSNETQRTIKLYRGDYCLP